MKNLLFFFLFTKCYLCFISISTSLIDRKISSFVRSFGWQSQNQKILFLKVDQWVLSTYLVPQEIERFLTFQKHVHHMIYSSRQHTCVNECGLNFVLTCKTAPSETRWTYICHRLGKTTVHQPDIPSCPRLTVLLKWSKVLLMKYQAPAALLMPFLLVRSVVGLCFDNTSSHVKLETGRLNVNLFLALHSYFPLSFHTADLIMRSDLRLEKSSRWSSSFWWFIHRLSILPQMDKNIFCSIPIYRSAIFEPCHLRCWFSIHFTHNPHSFALLNSQIGRQWFYRSTFTCKQNERDGNFWLNLNSKCRRRRVACVMDLPWKRLMDLKNKQRASLKKRKATIFHRP